MDDDNRAAPDRSLDAATAQVDQEQRLPPDQDEQLPPAAPAVSSAPSPSHSSPPSASSRRSTTWAVIAATMLFLGVCLSFLINTPTLLGPDEPYQFDRVVAAWNGQVVLDPEEINMSKGGRGVEFKFVATQMQQGAPSWADYSPLLRDERPSLNKLGGNYRSPTLDSSNYMTQHPPLYYALMGGLTWLVPNAADMPADTLVLIIRLFNVLLLLPLPYLFFCAARNLVGVGSIASAAAFLPLLIPGLARISATINNDNLATVLGAGIVVLCVKVMRGDRSLRTALLISVLAVAGSLTKGTIALMMIMIPIAYVLQAIRARSFPAHKVIVTLVVGAVAASAWWVRNKILFGKIQPDARGTQWAVAQGPPRVPGNPADWDQFWSVVYRVFPSRFFATLGLLEPPQLPTQMVWVLTGLVLVCIPVAAFVLSGRRAEVIVLAGVPLVIMAMTIYQASLHFASFLTIPGLQGRYTYPAAFGLVFPIAVVVGLVLGKWRRWSPLVIASGGLLVSGWAVYTSVEYTWLHRGEQLEPANWERAFRTLVGFFPLPGAATAFLAVVVVGILIAGTVLTVLSCASVKSVAGDNILLSAEVPSPATR